MSLQQTFNQKTEKTAQVSTKPQTAPVEASEKNLSELRERVLALEVKTSTMETGLSEVCRALEISGLMKDGEAVTAKKESVPETVFTCLNWGVLQSPNLGSFKVALKKDNNLEKWTKAYNILQKAVATINKRFLEPSYVHGYWVWQERPDRIFAKQLKQGTAEKTAESEQAFNPNLCGAKPIKKREATT